MGGPVGSHGPQKKKLCLSKVGCGRLHGSYKLLEHAASFTTAT